MRVGLLTGGGDCPGLNAVIRAVVRSGLAAGENSFLGFRAGWEGVLEDDAFELDLGGTDVTFGYQTAVQIVTDAIDRLHTTAESHNRVMVVEVMGRNAGWIATQAGIAGGADAILVPERPFDIDEVVAHLRQRHERGRSFSIVVVAEGATPLDGTLQTQGDAPTDAFGHVRLGGIGVTLEKELEARTGFEA